MKSKNRPEIYYVQGDVEGVTTIRTNFVHVAATSAGEAENLAIKTILNRYNLAASSANAKLWQLSVCQKVAVMHSTCPPWVTALNAEAEKQYVPYDGPDLVFKQQQPKRMEECTTLEELLADYPGGVLVGAHKEVAAEFGLELPASGFIDTTQQFVKVADVSAACTVRCVDEHQGATHMVLVSPWTNRRPARGKLKRFRADVIFFKLEGCANCWVARDAVEKWMMQQYGIGKDKREEYWIKFVELSDKEYTQRSKRVYGG